MVDGWPLIGEPDQVVGPIVPIQRNRIGRFRYRALVMGRTPCLNFGSFSVKDFPSQRGENDMSLLAAFFGIYFWQENKAKATSIRVGARVSSNNGNVP